VVASADVVRRPAGVRDAGLAHLLLEDGTPNYHGIAGLSLSLSVCLSVSLSLSAFLSVCLSLGRQTTLVAISGSVQAVTYSSLHLSLPCITHTHYIHEHTALPAGFAALQRAGGMANIQRFTFQLAQHLYGALAGLRHASSGLPVCEIYGRHAERSSRAQGSILTFNVRWADGSYVGFGEVGQRAAADGIQLRVGRWVDEGRLHGLSV
jgi:selenocysteine lyase/cysteine desulfurase